MNEFDAIPPHPQTPPSPMQAPLPASAEKSEKHTRRIFLFKLSLALNAAVGAVLAVPVLGYVMGPMFRKDSSYNSWIPLMDVGAIPVGATRLVEYENPVRTPTDGETSKVACWSRRLGESSYEVFAINCAHLGCPVRWFEQSQLFLCPCHGGAYYSDGSRASGPPERGLYKYDVRIEGGKVLIDAGEMPTLSNKACAEPKPLIQIEPITRSDGRDA
jgi:menaquinol-cytochrome c reductase iron-sulfur subunit